jgi:hypothetical protein
VSFQALLSDKGSYSISSNIDSEIDLDLDDCTRGLASLGRLNRHRNSIGRGRARIGYLFASEIDYRIKIKYLIMLGLIWNLRGVGELESRRKVRGVVDVYQLYCIGFANIKKEIVPMEWLNFISSHNSFT